jgi:hypothetical protein
MGFPLSNWLDANVPLFRARGHVPTHFSINVVTNSSFHPSFIAQLRPVHVTVMTIGLAEASHSSHTFVPHVLSYCSLLVLVHGDIHLLDVSLADQPNHPFALCKLQQFRIPCCDCLL